MDATTLAPLSAAYPPGCGWADALRLLKEAYDRAGDVGLDVWQFAVGIGELEATGIDHAGLRWLVTRGVVAHGLEVFDPAAPARQFVRLSSLSFPGPTCFTLTPAGHETADELCDGDDAGPGTPRWDSDRRELSWGGCVLKWFRCQAENQELILAAFEEDGWPGRIDDPLPPTYTRDSQSRLRDAIRRLNAGHARRAIRFHGDGTGTGICWRVCPTVRHRGGD